MLVCLVFIVILSLLLSVTSRIALSHGSLEMQVLK